MGVGVSGDPGVGRRWKIWGWGYEGSGLEAAEERRLLQLYTDRLGLAGSPRRTAPRIEDVAREDHAPIIGALGAGENLQQRRFAGAVLAQQRVRLSGFHGKLDVLQCKHAGKTLRDMFHL